MKSLAKNNHQKGVSLIIAFFITLIIIVIVLIMSTLLYSQIKIIRNIGESVVSFYLADSGAEKVLYYDRKKIIEGAARGICNICNDCPDCANCSPANPSATQGCAKCTDCHVEFDTDMALSPSKYYNVNVEVAPSPPLAQGLCELSGGSFQSYGTYMNTKRAINLEMTREVTTGLGPGIDGSGTTFTVKPNNTVSIYISAVINPNVPSITAYLYYSAIEGGPYTYQYPVPLEGGEQNGNWHKNLGSLAEGYYQVNIGVTDANGRCTSVTVTQ